VTHVASEPHDRPGAGARDRVSRIVVAGLNTTLVKSTSLRHPRAIDATPAGVAGDRRFLVLHTDGTRLRGVEKAPLLGIVVDEHDDALRFEWRDGTAVDAPVEPEGEPLVVALFDRMIRARRVRHPAVDDRLSAMVGSQLLLARAEDDDHAGGHHPLSLMSRATVADVGRRGGEPHLDGRRFRSTIELEGADPYEEDRWAGRRIRIGAAVVRIATRIPRCVLTTLDPDTGDRDFPTLDVLADYRREGTELPLGMYADIEEAGSIRVGDAVEVLDQPPIRGDRA
jgi:uncharacterized protein YcbX